MWMQETTATCGCTIEYRIVNSACCDYVNDYYDVEDVTIVATCEQHGYSVDDMYGS